ncbi:MAG: MarR family transcriptional regulator [Rhodospirillaceae bacterium]|nr:MarR family transcriptional regulator [Rhodospirillaceae bacterium]|tara:strand:+ start:2088 stop:2630 length:543 start_codon:yes stop_codon:yes gene_type:complete
MTDVKIPPNSPYLEEEELRQAIEMLFFAYRDFTKEPDKMLERIRLGRAHHRALYFIGRNPAITVTGLLDILKIRKQSLSRVLNQLIIEAYVHQEISVDDRRKKLLFLTKKGIGLERRLTANQRKRIAKAYKISSDQAIIGFKNILTAIINDVDQWRVANRSRASSGNKGIFPNVKNGEQE